MSIFSRKTKVYKQFVGIFSFIFGARVLIFQNYSMFRMIKYIYGFILIK